MKIIIVGCGKVGTSLAERLSVEDHDLVMVDLSEQKVEEVSNPVSYTHLTLPTIA